MNTDRSFKCSEQKHLGVGPGTELAPKEFCRQLKSVEYKE